ncbi:MAG: Spy/CpxP family protein refolding chaperone, partial [Candidatus Kryptoniota bacterium]
MLLSFVYNFAKRKRLLFYHCAAPGRVVHNQIQSRSRKEGNAEMSMRQIIILGLLVAFVIGVMASPAFMATQTNAQSDKASAASPAVQKPNLTDEQKAKIKSIFESAKQKAQSVKQDKTLSDEDKKAKIRAIYQDAKNEISGLLSPEQKQKLSVLKQKFGTKRHFA